VTLSKEWMQLGEQVLKPPGSSASLAQLIWETLLKCDPDVRKEIIANVSVHGGPAATVGLARRLQADLQVLAGQQYQTKVIALKQPQFSPWVGGSILGSMSTFPKMWISRVEYEESGPEIVFRKCF
jgi:actin-related protein